MSLMERVELQDGVSGPAAAAAAAVGNLSSAIKGLSSASAGSAAAELASIKANAQSRLQQEKAVQSAILASQKQSHALALADAKAASTARLANVKAESAAQAAAIKTDSAARAAAIKTEAAERAEALKEATRAEQAAAKETAKVRSAAAKAAAKTSGASASGPDISGPAMQAAGGDLFGAATAAVGMMGPYGKAAAVVMTAAHTLVSAVYAAYEQVTDVITGLGQTGIGMVFAATSAKESLVGTIEALGRTHGTATKLYEQITKQAIDTGRSKEAIAGEFKRMILAGFSNNQVGSITKMLGDVAAVKGEGKAGAIEKILTKIQAKGSMDKGTVTALERQHVTQKQLYDELAKVMHKKVADIPNLIKQGKIGAVDAENAITTVVSKSVAGAAEAQANTVTNLITRIKTAAEEMFTLDDKAMAPVKNFLQTVLKTIMGPEGQALKAAMGNLFGAIFDTALGDINKGNVVGDTMHQITGGVTQAAAAVRSLKPEVRALLAMFRTAMHDGTISNLVKAARAAGAEKIREQKDTIRATKAKASLGAKGVDWSTLSPGSDKGFMEQFYDTSETYQKIKRKARGIRESIGTDDAEDKADAALEASVSPTKTAAAASAAPKVRPAMVPSAVPSAAAANDSGPAISAAAANDNSGPAISGAAIPSSVTDGMTDSMTESGTDIGGALNMGMVAGIESTMSESLAAGGASAQALIEHVRAILGVHSPSAVFEEIGGFVGQGMAGGVAGSTGGVTKAVGGMAAAAVGAGTGAAGAAPSGGGGGAANGNGGGSVTVQVTVQAKPGESSEETGKKVGDAAAVVIQQTVRRIAGRG